MIFLIKLSVSGRYQFPKLTALSLLNASDNPVWDRNCVPFSAGIAFGLLEIETPSVLPGMESNETKRTIINTYERKSPYKSVLSENRPL